MADNSPAPTIVQQVIRVVDNATAPLKSISRVVDTVGGRFNHLTETVGHLTGVGGLIAGAFSFHHILKDTKEYYETIERIALTTRQTTSATAELYEAMSDYGIAGMTAERIMLSLSRRANAMGGSSGYMSKHFKQMGIDLKKGPQEALLKMADLVEKGKLSPGKISNLLMLRGKQAGDLARFLEQGKGKIEEAMEESRLTGGNAGALDMSQFKTAQVMWQQIKSTQEALVRVVAKEAFPAVLELMTAIKEKMHGWIPIARSFGKFLANNLDDVIAKVGKLGKALFANLAFMKLTGHGIVSGGLAGTLKNVSIIFLAITAIQMFINNTMGFRDALETLWLSVKPIIDSILEMFGSMAQIQSPMELIQKAITAVVTGLSEAVIFFRALGTTLANTAENIGVFINNVLSKVPGSDRQPQAFKEDNLAFVLRDIIEETQIAQRNARIVRETEEFVKDEKRRKAMAAADEEERKKLAKDKNNYDFRGSTFNIKQAFAEGFDPDRIALAFSSDLASLADRKLESGLSPIFGVR